MVWVFASKSLSFALPFLSSQLLWNVFLSFYSCLIKETMNTLDNICKASIDERAKLLKALNRVSETLEADSALKEEMKKIDQSYNTTFGNLLGLTEIIKNAKLLKLLTKLEGFQSTLNTLSTQCASISKSLKEDPEFNQRLLQAAEGYIQNSSRLTEISNSLQTINFPSLYQRISNIENTQLTMQSDISSIKRMVTEMLQNLEKQVIVWQKPPSYTEGEPMQIVTTTKKPEDEASETPMEQEPERPTRAVPISTVKPITRPNPKVALIESSSRPLLTDTILKNLIPQPTVQVPYDIHGKIYQLTNDEIQAHLDKEEDIKKKAEEARLLVMTKSKIIKVVHEEVEKAGIDPNIVLSVKGGEQFKRIQDAEHQVHKRMSDINKVGVDILLTYLVMASNITTPKNTRFCLKLRKLIAKHLDEEKL
ncbi:hypothetical protein Tco_0115072 [Tanacetum coccineum]